MEVQSERHASRRIACGFALFPESDSVNNSNVLIADIGEYRDVAPDIIRNYSHTQNPACDSNTVAGEDSYSIACERFLSSLLVQRFGLKQVINESSAI
jgi:hypothetical protein